MTRTSSRRTSLTTLAVACIGMSFGAIALAQSTGGAAGGSAGGGAGVGGAAGASGTGTLGGNTNSPTGQGVGGGGAAAPPQGQTAPAAPFGQQPANPGTAAGQGVAPNAGNANPPNANVNQGNAAQGIRPNAAQNPNARTRPNAANGSRTTNRVGTNPRTNAAGANNRRPGLADDRVNSANRSGDRRTNAAGTRSNAADGPQTATRPGHQDDDNPLNAARRNAAGGTTPQQLQNGRLDLNQQGRFKASNRVIQDGVVQDGQLRLSLNQLGFQIGTEDGALAIDSLTSSGLAAEAGLKQDDVITSINGQDVTTTQDLAGILSGLQPGDQVELTVDRNGTPHQLTFTAPDNFQNGLGNAFDPGGDRPIGRAFDQAGQGGADEPAAQIQSLRDELQALRAELQELRGR